jgi:hypothetical protein
MLLFMGGVELSCDNDDSSSCDLTTTTFPPGLSNPSEARARILLENSKHAIIRSAFTFIVNYPKYIGRAFL